MPYSRKTSQRFRRHVITHRDLSEANWQVTDEMDRLGLWHPRLDGVEVWHVPASFSCYGWFRVKGDIYIPALTGAQLSDYFFGFHTRLTDILRHEWLHALADRRPSLVRTRRFREVFGGAYSSTKPVAAYYPEEHLTRYAATSACEDLAETFSYYLRHKGRIPAHLRRKPAIVEKWQFIASMARP